MSKLQWIDPPEGHRWGFPRIWDRVEYPDLTAWLIFKGYPEQLARDKSWIRVWDVSEEEKEEYYGRNN